MRKFKFLICLLSISFVCFTIYAQEKNDAWDFPVKPGTEEWADLVTESERIDALQIPNDVLSTMSTAALVETCLNLPAFGYITAFNNIQTGFVILATKFNGLKELSKRQDVAKCLISIYQETGEKGFDNPNLNLDDKYWTIKFTWIELLIAQNKVLQSLDNEDKKKLLSLSQEKFNLKKVSKDYSLEGLKSTVFLMSRVLHSVNDDQFELEYSKNDVLKTFVETSELQNEQIISKVLELTNNYLNQ